MMTNVAFPSRERGGQSAGLKGGGCGQKVLSHKEIYSSIALWPWTNYFSVLGHVQCFVSSMCSAIKGGIRITAATTARNDGVPCVSGSHSLKARVLRRIICRPVFDQVPMASSGAREQERHSCPPLLVLPRSEMESRALLPTKT